VLQTLLPLLNGRLVVGHGVARDAAALGLLAVPATASSSGFRQQQQQLAGFLELQLPPSQTAQPPVAAIAAAYDTKSFPGFQGRGGAAFTLARLAREHLGRSIQQQSGRPQQQQPSRHQQQWRSKQRSTGQWNSGSSNSRQRLSSPSLALHNAVEDAQAVIDMFVKVARPRLLLDAAAVHSVGSSSSSSRGGGSGAYDRLVEVETAALLARMQARHASAADSEGEE